VLIVGAGGHGRSVAEALLLRDEHDLVGFLDDVATAPVWRFGIIGVTADLGRCSEHVDAAIVAIGNNRAREILHERLQSVGIPLITVIHPSAFVSPSAVIGAGCSIMAGAVVGTEASLGQGVIVNSGAVVDHHCKADDYAHLGVNAAMAGGSVLGRSAWMQAGAALGYNVQVGLDEILQPGEARTR
jgi:sugar O-acyltransferase (sialic acid O-acetyltransferase NeuD family)